MRRARSDVGTTVVELLVVLLVIAVSVALSAPVAASVIDASRARHAATFLSSRFRLARQEAVGLGVNVGVVFDQDAAGAWSVRVCRDGTRNGLRRADIQSGADPCFDGPYRVDELFPTVQVYVDPQLRGPAGEPGSPDPVRFGTANLVSFSPLGSCTAGSLFLRSKAGTPYVVRVGGATGRIRVMWYEASVPGWRDR
jgi:type II secretory pathway pseudopilin PulG